MIGCAAVPRPSRGYNGCASFLIGLGLAILLAGIAWPVISRLGLGRLPGDVVIGRGGTTFYFPIVTCIVISVVLSVVFWLFDRWHG